MRLQNFAKADKKILCWNMCWHLTGAPARSSEAHVARCLFATRLHQTNLLNAREAATGHSGERRGVFVLQPPPPAASRGQECKGLLLLPPCIFRHAGYQYTYQRSNRVAMQMQCRCNAVCPRASSLHAPLQAQRGQWTSSQGTVLDGSRALKPYQTSSRREATTGCSRTWMRALLRARCLKVAPPGVRQPPTRP